MKKIILGIITCLLSLSVFGQVNEFKFGFPLRANGGLNVGTDKVQLDSIVRDGTTIKFYTGVTELLPNMAGGSVTSVGMTVPTGLSISGSPITSSGTLALTFAPGYSIPSNALQSNWNTAYNWGDHNLGGYESSLGNPSVNGYILSSTTTGTRSWIAPPSGGSMIYPSGSGIPLVVSGTSWGTTITNNSANWNTAYGWGNHASAGYQTSTAILNSFAALTNSAGVLTNDGSGGLTWTAVGGTGTVTSVALSVPTGLSVTGSPITSSGTLAISLASGYSIPSTSVQSNWTTAYNERAQWDGGSTNLVASTGRTSLGATTVGSNLFTLNNPNAIRFIQINANNTVSALTATDLKTALSLTASDVSLGNVTNESKTTMFTSPIFTGVAPRLGSPVTDTLATQSYARSVGGSGGVTLETVQGEISDSLNARIGAGVELSDIAVMIADSTGNAPGNYVTRKALNDSINANLGGAVGITLNSGTITLNGDGGTADDITFYTNGDGSYNLPAGGGNLTIMSEVQGWINDSLDVIRPLYLEVADTANMLSHYAKLSDLSEGGVSLAAVQEEIADSLNAIRSASIPGLALADSTGYAPGNYVTHTQLDAFSGGSVDSSLYVTVTRLTDSLNVMRSLLNDLIAVVENLGVDLSAPIIDSLELGRFADDTLMIYLSEKMNTDSIPAASVFYLTEGGSEMGITSIGYQNDSVLYVVLDSAGVYGSTYLLDYARVHPYLQDSIGNALASFNNRTVTNYFEASESYPASLDNALVWCENDVSTMTVDGSNRVSVWNNQGTLGGYFEMDNTDDMPTWTNNSLVFDGVSDRLVMLSLVGNQPLTIYMVVNIDETANTDRLQKNDMGATPGNLPFGSTGRLEVLFGGAIETPAALPLDTWIIVRVTLNGVSSSIQVNDLTAGTGDAGTGNINYPSIFNGEVPGAIREYIIVPGGADSDIYDYLEAKHSIQ